VNVEKITNEIKLMLDHRGNGRGGSIDEKKDV
jgi:hypothetical protein